MRGWPGAAHPHLSPEGRSFPPGSRVELREPVARFSGADGPLPRAGLGFRPDIAPVPSLCPRVGQGLGFVCLPEGLGLQDP